MVPKLPSNSDTYVCLNLEIFRRRFVVSWLVHCQDCTTLLAPKELLYALPQVHLIYHQVSCLVLRRNVRFLLWPSMVNEQFCEHKFIETCGVSHVMCAWLKCCACYCLIQQNRRACSLVMLAYTELKITSPSAEWYTVALNICTSVSDASCFAICGL